ncbi:MAG: SDR family NAD(P)-dependent oxidoreductase, partial [Promethearchaeota archaeon]
MTISPNDFKDKNIIVTGCAGFIGSHLTEDLVNNGANVIGIDNLYNGSMDNLKNVMNQKNFKFHQADIRDKQFIREITKNVDTIFHEAAFIDVQLSKEMIELCNDVNVNGTLNILNAARINDVERMILASSAA